MGNLYVIHAEGTNYYKVGFTERPIGNRLSQLQVGCPQRLKVVRWYEFSASVQSETATHKALEKYHVHGEWFELSSIQIVDDVIAAMGHNTICQLPEDKEIISVTDLFGNQAEMKLKRKNGQCNYVAFQLDEEPGSEHLTTAQVAGMLGISRASLITFINRNSHIRPAHKTGQDFSWTKDEAEIAKRSKAKARRGRPSLYG